MKQLITFSPTFTPGNAGLGTLDFSAYPGFALDKLYAVIDNTQNTPLLIPGTPQFGFAGFANNASVIQLSANTSTYSSTDQLTVFYDAGAGYENNTVAERGGQLQMLQETTDQVLVELKVISLLLAQGLTLNMTKDDIKDIRDDITNLNNQPSTF